MYFFSENCRGRSPNFHIHVSVSVLYIPSIGLHISCSRIGRLMVGIYKSLTDTWMGKLGPWPCNFFSGYIRFKFSVVVLCSVVAAQRAQTVTTVQHLFWPLFFKCKDKSFWRNYFLYNSVCVVSKQADIITDERQVFSHRGSWFRGL